MMGMMIVCRQNLSFSVFILLCFSLLPCLGVLASEISYGRVTADNINVRSDATINSQIICQVRESDTVEVILDRYDWYKIKLPKTAPVFVKKELIACIDTNTAKAVKDNINIRLLPSESSVVLGEISKNEILNILEDQGDWYKIEPTDNSFGWIHKKFVEKTAPVSQVPVISIPTKPAQSDETEVEDRNEEILLEGVVQPYGKVFKRLATHKLVTKDQGTFLLKANLSNLNTLTYHRVKITGKLVSLKKQKYPVIEVVKMEALD